MEHKNQLTRLINGSFREELEAQHVDIRDRLLTSNATMKEGQVMTMYLSGQNASLTPVFAQQQDKDNAP